MKYFLIRKKIKNLMGNCYNIDKNENDMLSDKEHLEKINQNNKHLSENNIIDVDNCNNNIDNNNIETKINIITEQTNDINYISKTKLKLTIKQSKNLPEGKEYIMNSLGLLINNENKTNDGLLIFGDKNVCNSIYNNVFNIVEFSCRFYFPRRRKQH